MAPKRDKKKKNEEETKEEKGAEDETLLATTDFEQEQEEVQFTETSYTSASFESLPPVIEEPKKKEPHKKKKKKGEEEVKEIVSEAFNWSEESLPIIVEEEEKKVVEEALPRKKKEVKKGKKGKDKDKGEEIPDFEKPKNWKKMNQKEQEKWLVERIEEWRVEQEAARLAALAGAKEKRAALARERAELMARDLEEQEIRRDLLDKTCTLFQRFENQKIAYDNKQQVKAEWAQYLKCDGLPDPRIVTQMSTYLNQWREQAVYDDKELEHKCAEVLPMLEMLEEVVANSRNYTPRQAANYNEIRRDLRAQLSHAIEFASYFLLRDMESRLKMESVRLSTYGRQFAGLKLTLWCAIKMPTRMKKPHEPEPKPTELTFPAINVSVRLPKTLDTSAICVRASRSMVDLLSEKSKSFALAAELPDRYEDLFVFNVKEIVEVQKIKKEQDAVRTAFYKHIRERTKELEALIKANVYAKLDKERDELDELYLAEPPPMLDPRAAVADKNEKAFKRYLRSCNFRAKTGELNLRKYRICGGILNLDMLVAPPQPKPTRFELQLTTLLLPKKLKAIDYKVQYRAPGPPPPGVVRTPEEIETQMKKVEEAYQLLALVSIDLPPEVMWTEPPVVCQWQKTRNLWTSNYVNDYKYNEDHLTLQFRTGVLWPIGIATSRYSNLPCQGWDLRPDPNSKGVLVNLTGACINVTLLCLGNYVKLKSIHNYTTRALREHLNVKYTVKRLVQIMREAACDFFPDFDGHNHVQGSCPKEWVSERHLYHAMAFMSRAYNFQWSRWNVNAGWRNIVIQLREAVDKKRESKLQLLCATPQRAYIMKCNEMSQEFDFEPMPGMTFFPDLFILNMSYGSVDARRETFNMKFKLSECVFNLLQEMKLCSFC